MTRPLSHVLRVMTDTAEEVCGHQSSRDLDLAARRLLLEAIDCDEVLLTRLDLASDSTFVLTGPELALDDCLSRALSRVGKSHPAVLSYLSPDDDRAPRRVSDVISDRGWRECEAYQDAFRERAALRQLSLVTSLGATCGVGWVLTRSGSNFADEDVGRAALMLPLLTVIERLGAPERRIRVAARARLLTPRERVVLDMLATGCSARQIARDLGIAETTTRKHLAHIYRKLGVQDRLSAVLAMQSS